MSESSSNITPFSDPDEINLLEYFYVIIKNKWLIIGLTILGYIAGHIAANRKGPVFIADAIIAPKETESVQAPNISGLGMFGGAVANQLNIGGNASLDKIELLLGSRSFNAKFVEKMELIPVLYFEFWDTLSNNWIEGFKPPKYLSAGGYAKSFLKYEIEDNGTMKLKIEHKDSLTSNKLLFAYIKFLDFYIKENVQKDAKENRDYLENQLISVTDPLLRAKFQELIAKEVEKMMVVSKEAFRIIDNVFVSKSFKEKKLYPLAFAFGLFFGIVLILIVIHALFSAKNTKEDKKLIENIKKEIFRIK